MEYLWRGRTRAGQSPAAAAIVAARRAPPSPGRRQARALKTEPDATQQAALKRTASALMPVSLGFQGATVLFNCTHHNIWDRHDWDTLGVSPRAASYRNAESFFR